MSRLQDMLVEQYADHYSRVNMATNPAVLTDRQKQILRLNFGPVLSTLPAQSRLLDVGCGTGYFANWLAGHPGAKVSGIDASPTQIEVAKRFLPELDLACVDGMEYLRAHPQTFDGIFCIDILEHIPADVCLEWVETIYSALKPGGFLCCRVPNAASLIASYSFYMDLTHQRIYTHTSMQQLLETAGFVQCVVLPERAPHLSGKVRLQMEAMLHQIVFRICGRNRERVFTRNLTCVAHTRK